MVFLAGGCSENVPFNQIHSSLYQLFWSNIVTVLVKYKIINARQNRSLIITSSNNNKANYENRLL